MTKEKITDTIKRAEWYSEAYKKVQDGSFTFSWLSEKMLGIDSVLAYDVMFTFMDLAIEEQRKENKKMQSKLRIIGRSLILLGNGITEPSIKQERDGYID